MFIEPNTNIRILSHVPLTNEYKHTLYWKPENKSKQTEYFKGKTKHNLLTQSYQRVNRGVARVGLKAESLYDCNYMMFQNTSFGDKWFYAFITKVEYINNIVSEITFEIDVLQTWYFDYELRDCFVEREHSETDEIGDNILPEPLEVKDYVCRRINRTHLFDHYSAVICTAYNPLDILLHPSVNEIEGGKISNLFSGVDYIAVSIENDAGVKELLDILDRCTIANKAESIVAIVMMPTNLLANKDVDFESVYIRRPLSFTDGYEPRNKKLLTFPYNYLGVDCSNDSIVYRYEYFQGLTALGCRFAINSSLTPDPEVMLTPCEYNVGIIDQGSNTGSTQLVTNNYVEKLVLKGFPQCAFSIDGFRAWLASQAAPQALGIAASVGAGVAGVATANVPAAIAGFANAATATAQMAISANQPDRSRGTIGNSVEVATRTKDFYFKEMQIHPQQARIIDEYFDMYGYATNRVKTPNISARPLWNYTKTKDCMIVGDMPADDIKKICGIFNNGITFWKDPSKVCCYHLADENIPE